MQTTLRDAKARLSSLVALAQRGEDVVISVRGRPRARLIGVAAAGKPDMALWGRELEALRRRWAGRKRSAHTDTVIEDLREERCCSALL